MRQLMREEISVFSVTNKDIGCVKTSQMKLNLKDQVLVQQNCNSNPKQFYNDMECYIKDLLNKQWIVHSHSQYSSPVAAVRNKDGTICLCCGCRKLNQKSITDRHPLPSFQSVIDNLGKNQFLSPIHCIHNTMGILRVGLGAHQVDESTCLLSKIHESMLRCYQDDFVIPNLDDLLIYSSSLDKH